MNKRQTKDSKNQNSTIKKFSHQNKKHRIERPSLS